MNQIEKELEFAKKKELGMLAMVSTTSGRSNSFSVLPRRYTEHFLAINFLVSNEEIAEDCLRCLDGRVNYILVDQELKKDLNLNRIAKNVVNKSEVIAYKPNDATLEATDLLVREHVADHFLDKNILMVGLGNIGGKLALRLQERGAQVTVIARNFDKATETVKGLNHILPRHASSIHVVKNVREVNKQDILISFVSAKNVVTEDYLDVLGEGSIAVDGGINNFSPDFIQKATETGVKNIRVDVRLGFPYTLHKLLPETKHFFSNVQGKRKFLEVNIVAGGIIGEEGDVIVDQIKHPTQIIGIANGTGGLKDENEYTERDRSSLHTIRKHLK
ncbi:hypothetical protein HNR44_001871 [Geomicrobium halophilum]|uniref:6-phosphogluconate dehydrogenase NADP-binding domain-containing protein n=1 Tax=Geomicrobium halophilum TaxID=549000 RepID=A0A841PYT6_9BACL|nr:NAD(P)-binding domain-containing protein [Geomicrobium halophilum]MBB6449893.1 hypothetical protein [Geomicrobium halophilum]